MHEAKLAADSKLAGPTMDNRVTLIYQNKASFTFSLRSQVPLTEYSDWLVTFMSAQD